MTPRTVRADAEIRRGRLAEAEQLAAAATVVQDLADESEAVGDAFVTLCVHAGIASADVICATRLGEHARGEHHDGSRSRSLTTRPTWSSGSGTGSVVV